MKKYSLLAALFVFAQGLFAQSTFERIIDLPGDDWGTFIVRDSNNSRYAISSTHGTWSAGEDYGLLVVDSCGAVNSFTSFGSTGLDFTRNLLVDGSRYVIYGQTFGSILGVYLVGINPSYTNYFKTTAGGYSTHDEGNYITKRIDTAVYVGLGATQSYGSGKFDMYLVQYNQSGTATRGVTIGTDSTERGYCIQTTSDSGFILVGYTDYQGLGKDVYVVKLDRSYNVSWSRMISTEESLDEVGNHIIEVNNGISEYYLTGYRERVVTLDDTTYTNRDVLVIKLDDDGVVDWAKSYGGNADEEGKQIIKYESGLAITGYTESFGAGGKDAFVMSIDDSDGDLNWGSTYGSLGDDYANSLALTWEQDGFMVVGATDSTADFSPSESTYLFRTDLYGEQPCPTDSFGGVHEMDVFYESEANLETGLASNKLGGFREANYTDSLFCDNCTGDSLKGPGRHESKWGHGAIDEEGNVEPALFVYPNPSAGEVHISIPASAQSGDEIVIMSTSGGIIYRQDLENRASQSTLVIKLPETAANGLYFVQLRGIESRAAVPFILSR